MNLLQHVTCSGVDHESSEGGLAGLDLAGKANKVAGGMESSSPPL